MSFIITHRYGAMERTTSMAAFPQLLRELDDRKSDTEHGSVSVTHESEWCISVSRDGLVIFEHLEKGGERHMQGVSEAKVIELLGRLAIGDIASLEEENWIPGYP